jgi:hypothetical protein
MKIQNKTDWIEYILAIMAVLFIFFCVLVIKEAKAYHDKLLEAPKYEMREQYREIPKCDKELWLRIKDGCP